jgi:FkbM family methyltransferase
VRLRPQAETSRRRLEELLSSDASAQEKKNRSRFDEIAGLSESIVLFGAGVLGVDTLSGLKRLGIQPLAFSDNSRNRWGETIDGVPILSPADAVALFGRSAAFVVTVYNGSGVRRQLEDIGCRFVVPFPFLYWKYAETFLPYFGLDFPMHVTAESEQVMQAYNLFADEASRQEYTAQIEWRMTLNYSVLPRSLPADEMYFPAEIFQLVDDEVFLDCGAFDGDTIRSFIDRSGGRFSRIIALEPDPVNLASLGRFVSTLGGEMQAKITIVPAAVVERSRKLRFSARGSMLSEVDPEGESEVEGIRIDDLELDPTYVKIDVEGSDPDAIRGGAEYDRTTSPNRSDGSGA